MEAFEEYVYGSYNHNDNDNHRYHYKCSNDEETNPPSTSFPPPPLPPPSLDPVAPVAPDVPVTSENMMAINVISTQSHPNSIPQTITTQTTTFTIPNLSEDQQYIFEQYLSGKNIFMTGSGGCGKTFMIRYIYNHATYKAEKNIQVCAMTGCAAVLLQCKAKTLHSWSGIGIGKIDEDIIIQRIINNHFQKKNWKRTQILIIDEVSMMSQYLFEMLDRIAKSVRRDGRPFGGIQVIFSGDFYQLPPIADKENSTSGNFCFESPYWSRVFDVQVMLDVPFRQKDPYFIELLNQIREGKITAPYSKMLEKRIISEKYKKRNKHVIKKYNDLIESGIMPVKLFPIKSSVKIINETNLAKLETKEVKFNYIIEFDKYEFLGISDDCLGDGIGGNNKTPMMNAFKFMMKAQEKTQEKTREKREEDQSRSRSKALNTPKMSNGSKTKLPTDMQLEKEEKYMLNNLIIDPCLKLKVGSQVMLLVNMDIDNFGLCNGSTGIIERIVEDEFDHKDNKKIVKHGHVVVKFHNGIMSTIGKHTWKSENIKGVSLKQIPLTLSWAITIHKSQGSTLDYAEIDIGNSVFSEGQTYVALSRLKSIDGLFINNYNPSKIKANQKVNEFYKMFYEDTEDTTT
jgi:ATP-dependent DNA helicase PIF1